MLAGAGGRDGRGTAPARRQRREGHGTERQDGDSRRAAHGLDRHGPRKRSPDQTSSPCPPSSDAAARGRARSGQGADAVPATQGGVTAPASPSVPASGHSESMSWMKHRHHLHRHVAVRAAVEGRRLAAALPDRRGAELALVVRQDGAVGGGGRLGHAVLRRNGPGRTGPGAVRAGRRRRGAARGARVSQARGRRPRRTLQARAPRPRRRTSLTPAPPGPAWSLRGPAESPAARAGLASRAAHAGDAAGRRAAPGFPRPRLNRSRRRRPTRHHRPLRPHPWPWWCSPSRPARPPRSRATELSASPAREHTIAKRAVHPRSPRIRAATPGPPRPIAATPRFPCKAVPGPRLPFRDGMSRATLPGPQTIREWTVHARGQGESGHDPTCTGRLDRRPRTARMEARRTVPRRLRAPSSPISPGDEPWIRRRRGGTSAG